MNQPIEEKWKGSWRWRSDRMGLDKDQHDEILDFIENLLEQERKRMSEEVKGRKSKLSYGAYTTQDAKVFWEGKDAAFDEVLSIINK